MDWNDVVPHLTGLAHIATTDADGHAAVAVVSPLVIDSDVWFQARRSSAKVRNLVANPSIALMWQPAGEAYVWGSATVVDDVGVKRQRWSEWHYDAASFFGTPEDDGVVVVRVTPQRATVLTAVDGAPTRLRWNA